MGIEDKVKRLLSPHMKTFDKSVTLARALGKIDGFALAIEVMKDGNEFMIQRMGEHLAQAKRELEELERDEPEGSSKPH